MTYFQYTQDDNHHQTKWEKLYEHVNNNDDFPFTLTHHLEAKALQVFSIAWRLVQDTHELANNKWNQKFIGAFTLLFPMIELIGGARKPTHIQNLTELTMGIYWLLDYEEFKPYFFQGQPVRVHNDTRRLDRLAEYMSNHPDGVQVNELYSMRNYFEHGSKNYCDDNDMPNIMNAELPKAISQYAKEALRGYWKQLKDEDGSNEQDNWIKRLAEAQIRPFIVQGSIFEYGLIDPDIITFLEE